MTNLQSDLIFRQLPSNILAEQMLLGTLLVDNKSLPKVIDFLLPEHFYDPIHTRIYSTIAEFCEKGIVANAVTLKPVFERDEAFIATNRQNYLFELSSLAATIISVTDYGRLIQDLGLKRQLIEVGQEIVNSAFENAHPLSTMSQVEAAEQSLYNIVSTYDESVTGFVQIKDPLTHAVQRAQYAFQRGSKVSGIPTGFVDLDDMLGGLQNSDLFILAGRPAMGKTALAVNLALNCAHEFVKDFEIESNKAKTETSGSRVTPKQKSVGLFSLEMSSEQLASRLISMISGVSTPKLRNGHLTDDDFGLVISAAKELQALPIFIDDTAALSISAIRTRARRLKRKHNLGLIVIDYLQLIRGSMDKKEHNRVQEVSEVTQGLKAIAKELNVPILALSQLSRAVEQREDKRPLLSDLRDSGSIEQDADIVAFIYRPSYYLLSKKPIKEGTEEFYVWQQQLEEVSNLAEILIAKHRNGPVGDVKLYFDSILTKFSNLSPYQGYGS